MLVKSFDWFKDAKNNDFQKKHYNLINIETKIYI